LPLGFGVGAELDCIPLEADDRLLPDLYHGLERHSDSVPDAVARHPWKLLKELPLQPGLSMRWIQTGYWVAIWADAGPSILNPHMASNVRRMMRIALERAIPLQPNYALACALSAACYTDCYIVDSQFDRHKIPHRWAYSA
jgi:hypothetical protein